jgi:hypothetical protein
MHKTTQKCGQVLKRFRERGKDDGLIDECRGLAAETVETVQECGCSAFILKDNRAASYPRARI